MVKSNTSVDRRKARVRRAVLAHSGGRPRLSVFRSSKQIYAQVIDDEQGRDDRRRFVARKGDARIDQDRRRCRGGARRVGKELAERAKKAGVEKVVFDRGGYMYHGRVKALAEGAREGGLDF